SCGVGACLAGFFRVTVCGSACAIVVRTAGLFWSCGVGACGRGVSCVLFQRCLKEVPLHRRELSLLCLGLLVSQVTSRLKFAAYPLNDAGTDAVDLCDVAPDNPPVIGSGEQPPQQAFCVGG